jgi:hypothetical protein
VLLDEVLRLHARRKVHPKTSTVEVGGVAFVVDASLRRRKVDVLYDVADLSSVLIYFDGRRIERATPQVKGEAPVEAPAAAQRPAPSVLLLQLEVHLRPVRLRAISPRLVFVREQQSGQRRVIIEFSRERPTQLRHSRAAHVAIHRADRHAAASDDGPLRRAQRQDKAD